MLESITFDVEYGAKENEQFKDSDGWTCTIEYEDREIEVEYYMGYGHGGAEPELEAVLNCLFTDAYALDVDFNEWCKEFGYSNDSIKALHIYNDCKGLGSKLEYLFGKDYEEIEEEIRELDL